jgi:hypothetical protein
MNKEEFENKIKEELVPQLLTASVELGSDSIIVLYRGIGPAGKNIIDRFMSGVSGWSFPLSRVNEPDGRQILEFKEINTQNQWPKL